MSEIEEERERERVCVSVRVRACGKFKNCTSSFQIEFNVPCAREIWNILGCILDSDNL